MYLTSLSCKIQNPLLNALFSKFKIDHFEVFIPPADDLNYQTFCTRDVIQISASSHIKTCMFLLDVCDMVSDSGGDDDMILPPGQVSVLYPIFQGPGFFEAS